MWTVRFPAGNCHGGAGGAGNIVRDNASRPEGLRREARYRRSLRSNLGLPWSGERGPSDGSRRSTGHREHILHDWHRAVFANR